MSSGGRGQGVRKFWEARAAGAAIDPAALARDYPDEALALADAVREAAAQDESAAHERMWLARARALRRSGEDVTLGALLRGSRQGLGLSAVAVSSKVSERGASLHPMALEQLEADRVTITNVRTPGLWQALLEVLELDRHQLVAAIRAALSRPQVRPKFTRMDRGATPSDRERFLESAATAELDDAANRYLEGVRSELGLPPTPPDAV